MRVEQHLQALARLVAAEEEDRRTVGRASASAFGEPLDLDAVEQQLVGRRRGTLAASACASSDTAQRRSRRPASQRTPGRATGSRRSRRRRGTCRPAAPAAARSAVMRGAGGERLVQVEHVELLVPQGPDGAELRRGVGRERGHRAVGGGRDAVAERRHPGVGRRPVAGPEHPRLVAAGAAATRARPEHLPLHAPGHGQAVGADQPDPHPPNATARPGTEAVERPAQRPFERAAFDRASRWSAAAGGLRAGRSRPAPWRAPSARPTGSPSGSDAPRARPPPSASPRPRCTARSRLGRLVLGCVASPPRPRARSPACGVGLARPRLPSASIGLAPLAAARRRPATRCCSARVSSSVASSQAGDLGGLEVALANEDVVTQEPADDPLHPAPRGRRTRGGAASPRGRLRGHARPP